MKYLFLLVLLGWGALLCAQSWHINVDAGLAGFPQEDRDPGFQTGIYLERSLPLVPRVSLVLFGGARRLEYTNTTQYFGSEPIEEIPFFCDCSFPNERYVFDRTELNAGVGLTFSTSKFRLTPSISLGYDLYSEVEQQSYGRISSPGELIRVNRQRLWKAYSDPFQDRLSRSRELSRRIHPYAGLTLGYQLNDQFQLRLLWQQSLGPMQLTRTEYRERSGHPNNIINTSGPFEIADASLRSILLGLQYKL